MWQTITTLFGSRGKLISFGVTVIYCDANNVWSVYDALDVSSYANLDDVTVVAQ